MIPIKWMIPIVCFSSSVVAQSTTDLNGLVSAAAHYVSSGMSGARDPETLELSKIVGNYGNSFPDVLMTKATDVQHWTFLYKIKTTPDPTGLPGSDPKPKPHRAVQAECTQGIFNNFRYSSSPVTGVKSLEYTWVAVSLDAAIANLNANGYVRGFSSVELQRPNLPNWPDDYVYVFTCPWERRAVGISCQNGSMVWNYGY
ncbi:MAG: hypothetical protein P4L36_07055 [Holophaga sp.]|nr:hypothetical protein [Holophaga sp.]